MAFATVSSASQAATCYRFPDLFPFNPSVPEPDSLSIMTQNQRNANSRVALNAYRFACPAQLSFEQIHRWLKVAGGTRSRERTQGLSLREGTRPTGSSARLIGICPSKLLAAITE